MKICLINNLYGNFARGGAERIVRLSADGFLVGGHEVVIVTTCPPFSRPKGISGGPIKIRYLKSLYHHLERLPKILRLVFHIFNLVDVVNYYKLKTILEQEKPEIVLTHNLTGIGFLTPMVIKKLNIKHAHTLHDIQLLHPSGLMFLGKEGILDSAVAKIYQRLCARLFSCIPVVISPSLWLMGEHEKRNFFSGAVKIILPNPVPLAGAKIVHAPRKNTGEFKFFYVGLIEEHKGVILLLHVFDRLTRKIPGLKLVIAGEGTKLKTAVKMAGHKGNIQFSGRIDHAQVMALMAQADCLICPSLCYENSPTVIYEAISMGLPVIASRLGGITELAHKFGGILFDPRDEHGLEKKIEWVINNPVLANRMAGQGRVKIRDLIVDGYVGKLLRSAMS